MKRAIHIFPDTRPSPFIEALRQNFDPLHPFIAAHLTLVFPFDSSVSDIDLIRHCVNQAAAFDSFSFTLDHPEKSDDGLFWLPVRPVPPVLLQLRNALHTGLLADQCCFSKTYCPHLTVARPPLPTKVELALFAGPESYPFSLEAGSITIERILDDNTSKVIRTIQLGHAQPYQPG